MGLTFFGLSELTVVTGPLLAAAESGLGGLNKLKQPWRPEQWLQPATTMITVPSTSGPAVPSAIPGLPDAPAYQGEPEKYLVFDAVFKIEHSRELRRTEHPIQASGSSPTFSITDHAFRVPARVTLEIGMSDAMQSYFASAWAGSGSKSVACYQQLVDLQKQRRLVTLTTRLETYANMLIESIQPVDTQKSKTGLRAVVTLGEIWLADATAVSSKLLTGDDMKQANPTRANTTAATKKGTLQTGLIPSALKTQNVVKNIALVPGAGKWSSINVNRLKGLLG